MIPYAGARAAQGLRQVVRDAGPPRHRDPATDDHTHRGIHPGETSAATHNLKTLSLRRKKMFSNLSASLSSKPLKLCNIFYTLQNVLFLNFFFTLHANSI